MTYDKARIKLLDKNTGKVLKEVDPYTSADAVSLADGTTVQSEIDSINTAVQKNTDDINKIVQTDLVNINSKDITQDTRISNAENKDTQQDTRLNALETAKANNDKDITNLKLKNSQQDARLDDFAFAIAGGTATALTVAMDTDYSLNGYSKSFIASANNSGAASTLNGKKIYKPNTTTAPNLVAGKAYTVWYDLVKDCFFVKASAEGTALPAYVLAPYTFSNNDDTGIAGTIPTKSAATITPTTSNQTIAPGQYIGDVQTILGDANLISSNIKSGIKIFNVQGKASVVDTADATANAGLIYNGQSAYINGTKVVGTMPVNPGLISETNHIQAATYTVGSSDPDGLPHIYLRPGIAGGRQCIDGDMWITAADENFVASNIVNGTSIFGLAGNAQKGYSASGTATRVKSYLTNYYGTVDTNATSHIDISGCFNFNPHLIYGYTTFTNHDGGRWNQYFVYAKLQDGTWYQVYQASGKTLYSIISIDYSNIVVGYNIDYSGTNVPSGDNYCTWYALG